MESINYNIYNIVLLLLLIIIYLRSYFGFIDYMNSREAFLLVHLPKGLPDVLIFFLMSVLLILLIFPLISSIICLSPSLFMFHSFIPKDYLMAIWLFSEFRLQEWDH